MKNYINKRLVFCGIMCAIHFLITITCTFLVVIFAATHFTESIEGAFFWVFISPFIAVIFFMIIAMINDHVFGVIWFGDTFKHEMNRLKKIRQKIKK